MSALKVFVSACAAHDAPSRAGDYGGSGLARDRVTTRARASIKRVLLRTMSIASMRAELRDIALWLIQAGSCSRSTTRGAARRSRAARRNERLLVRLRVPAFDRCAARRARVVRVSARSGGDGRSSRRSSASRIASWRPWVTLRHLTGYRASRAVARGSRGEVRCAAFADLAAPFSWCRRAARSARCSRSRPRSGISCTRTAWIAAVTAGRRVPQAGDPAARVRRVRRS